jgi:phosphatidylglycerol---prolipoprotein diacylglyceryl transferase
VHVFYFIDFTLWTAIGAILGLWRLAKTTPRQSGIWVNVGLFVLMTCLIGARLSYIFINRTYFSIHPLEMLIVWLGGLTWPGALLGALLTVMFLAIAYRSPRTGRVSIGWIGDRLYPLLPPVVITAWLGSWQTGVAYGSPVPSGIWWGVPSMDETGAIMLRWPVQLAAVLSLLIFFILLEMRVRPLNPPGRLSGIALFGLLVHLLIFSFLCVDPSPYWNGLRVDTWAAIIYLMLFLSFLLLNGLVSRVSRRLRRILFSYDRP